MIEPSGLYWVSKLAMLARRLDADRRLRDITVLRLEKGDKLRRLNWKS